MHTINPGIMASFAGGTSFGPQKLIDIINRLGLTTSLDLVLDAGDSDSYAGGSGQTWFDVSGNNNDFFRGNTSGAESVDPTFNGSAGDLTGSTYWSSDGADYFVESAAHTYATNWHKNNGAFTIIAIYWPLANKTVEGNLFANRNINAGEDGVMVGVNATNKLYLRRNTSDAATQETVSTATVTGGRYEFLAVAFEESSTSYEFRINTTAETGSSLTASTNATNPARADAIGRDYAATQAEFENTERLILTAHWSRKLTSAELTSLYDALNIRFTLPS